ncbi:MAG TPA: hypothetical protein VK968_16285, partial [Roseimicrobium sp.]|nr:hypothetical protein [Roseimicrobium sp.]
GEFFLNWAMSEDASVSGGLSAPIVDGRAEFELPAGALFQLRNGSLHGGTIDESKRYQVTGNPTVITVKVKPAGLIRVKVLEKDGRLATGMYVGGRSVSDPNKHLEIKDMVSGSEAPREWYPSQSIELGSEKYVIRALAGNRVVLSAPVRVDEDAPIKDVVLTLPEPTTREVLVVDERGAPVPDVGLQALLEFNGEKFYGASTQLDSSGVARVILGNGGAKVKMSLRVLATNLVPTFQPVDFSKAAQIRLVVPTGHRVTGRVVDRESGAGVPEVEICWAVDQMYAPSLKTDAAGRFEFLNCPPGRVFLSTRLTNGRNFDKGQSFYATSDGAEFVIYTREGPQQ